MPAVEIYCDRALPWVQLAGGMQRFAQMRPIPEKLPSRRHRFDPFGGRADEKPDRLPYSDSRHWGLKKYAPPLRASGANSLAVAEVRCEIRPLKAGLARRPPNGRSASPPIVTLGGVLARRRPPTAAPASRRMPEPNTGDRNSHRSRVEEFRTAKLRRGSPDVCSGQGCGKDDRRLLRFSKPF
jgi:hypothetical protein